MLEATETVARRGRPPVPEGQRQTERFELRLTPAQRAKLADLGDANWVRSQIDRAKVKAE